MSSVKMPTIVLLMAAIAVSFTEMLAIAAEPESLCSGYPCGAEEKCVLDTMMCIPEMACPPGPQPTCMPRVRSLNKAGSCPTSPAEEATTALSTPCNNDQDCPGEDKCCFTSRGTKCSPPEPGSVVNRTCNDVYCGAYYRCVTENGEPRCVLNDKEGFCPVIATTRPADYSSCQQRCDYDDGCPGVTKCCKDAWNCDATCVDPVPEVTCALMDCPAGKVCVMLSVHCVRAPCFPVPTCVSRDAGNN